MKKVWFGLIVILLIIIIPVYADEIGNSEVINEENIENEEIIKDTFPLLENKEEKQEINSSENSKFIITIHYLEENKKVLCEDTVIEKETNQTYEVFPKDFDNYILIDVIGETKGIINKDLDITFIYKEDKTIDIDDKDYVEEKDIEEDEYLDQSEEFLTDGMFLSMGAVKEVNKISNDIENPNTSDNINIYFYLSLISIISITNLLILRKRLAC